MSELLSSAPMADSRTASRGGAERPDLGAARRLLALALVVVAAVGAGTGCEGAELAGGNAGSERARVLAARDGDTIVVRDGRGRREAVRLLAVDTPESVRPGTPVECGSREAKSALVALVFARPRDRDGDGLLDGGRGGRRVWLESDPASGERDRFGRRLSHVHLGSPRGRTLAERQIAAGWGEPYVFRGQGTRYLVRYRRVARRARRASRGVWGRCGGDFHSGAASRGQGA